MKQDDERAFEQLVRRNGTAWIFDRLQNLGGPQLLLLHLSNSLSDYPSTADDSFCGTSVATRHGHSGFSRACRATDDFDLTARRLRAAMYTRTGFVPWVWARAHNSDLEFPRSLSYFFDVLERHLRRSTERVMPD